MWTTRAALAALLAVFAALIFVPPASAIPTDIARVAFIGDSFEEGYGAPVGKGYLNLMENWQTGDNVLPLAHGGATVRRYLPGGPWHSDLDRLTTWAPSAVVIPLGTNDWYIARPVAEYRADLTALIAEVRARVPYGTRIILWHHFGGYVKPNPAICDMGTCAHQNPPASWAAYGTAMRNVAIAQSTGYVDDSTAYPWHRYLYDGLHPNTAGHNLLFQSINYRLYYCC